MLEIDTSKTYVRSINTLVNTQGITDIADAFRRLERRTMIRRLTRHALMDGFRTACDVIGQGPPIVLIYGTPSHFFIRRNAWAPIVEAGYAVYRFDLLGFAPLSDRPSRR
jgi:pimeloyl-ACP methyl ester carboxylesterase